ncbi:MAG: heavy-metal-associated domain-containing protein [Anaerolineae bacterium]|nr:heavy-metal-associated domain-containing protein [Anaerolineae bacterium]
MQTVTLEIPNISCNHCVMSIKRETATVDGAEFVSGDVSAKKVVVRVEDDAVLTALKEALTEIGYPPAG